MGSIQIDRALVSFDQIKKGYWPSVSPYADLSLDFCSAWLSGQDQFELKTSGSTGDPKTIKISRSQMEFSAAATRDFFLPEKLATLLCCLNTEMIAGKMMLVRAMEWDADVVLIPPTQNPLMAFEEETAFDFVAMVPLQVEACLAEEKSRKVLAKVRNLIIGGAPLEEKIIYSLAKLPTKSFLTFGMTETVSHFALSDLKAKPITFRTLPGVKIGSDHEHKLWVEAPMAISPRLQTQDLVEIIREGQFIWKGRADFTINSGGIKIQPELMEKEIEDLIREFSPNSRYFLAAEKDEKLGEKLVLILESQPLDKILISEFLDSVKSKLPKFHNPKELYTLPVFQETPSGKINRPATLQKLGNHFKL
ncbi:AMP-binding protein [Pararhodonellum marinum]|uniref:AMP-binding protein n=1 Tax=Pararhodonellum marinum TaxID=2755358 RepID=UPI00188F57D7|nr:AMP-binding protein [Pararhodonellum marinum]